MDDLDRALKIISKAHEEEENPTARLSLRAAVIFGGGMERCLQKLVGGAIASVGIAQPAAHPRK